VGEGVVLTTEDSEKARRNTEKNFSKYYRVKRNKMESRDHYKNGAGPKSQMSREK